jgi:ABC-2 type transport system permease protein
MKVTAALWVRNLRAFVRNKPAMIFNLIFPFFFIFVFGEIFRFGDIANPISYMLAGIIVATVFDSSFRVSSSTIDDMTSGFMKEVLVSPISRMNVAIGQFVSSATVATVQGFIIIIVGFFIGVRITSVLTMLYAVLVMIFIGLVLAGFGLLIATLTKNTQTFQAVSIAITMPMTFMSGAYIPLGLLPDALQFIAYFNPLTYAVALFRVIILEKLHLPVSELVKQDLAFEIGAFTIGPAESLVILMVFGGVFLALSASAFSRVDFSRMNRSKDDYLEI